MEKIRSVKGLAAVLGADDTMESSISQRVYKDTICGAWVKLLEPGVKDVGSRKETWTALINPSIVGPKVVKVRRNGSRSIDPLDAPKHVKCYLCLTKDRGIEGEKSFDEFVDRLHLSPDTVKNMVAKGIGVRITFEVEDTIYKKHKGGIRIGSIVEGADAEVVPVELFYPFTEEDLDKAIGTVEGEASRIWNETHGCDDCGMDGAINPNCKSCNGEGAVL